MNILENISLLEFLGVLILSLVPSIILISLVLISDQKSREPLRLIIICLLSGFFTISFSLLIGRIALPQLNLFRDTILNIKTFSVIKIILLAMIEEYSKLIVLYAFMSHNKKFDDIYDGFVYSALITLSFASMETVLYVFNETTYQSMTSLAVLRNITTVPLHFVCGITMGYYIALNKFSKTNNKKVMTIAKSIIMPAMIHSIYNSFFSLTMINLKTKPYAIFIILLFLVSIYTIGYLYYRKTKDLNKIFETNGEYPEEFNYLMTASEFNKKEQLLEAKDSSLEEILYNNEDFKPFNNNDNVI